MGEVWGGGDHGLQFSGWVKPISAQFLTRGQRVETEAAFQRWPLGACPAVVAPSPQRVFASKVWSVPSPCFPWKTWLHVSDRGCECAPWWWKEPCISNEGTQLQHLPATRPWTDD